MVALEAALEEEVLGECDGAVDCEPVRDDEHEIFEDVLEVTVAWYGDGNVDAGADESPDEAWDFLGPAGEDLKREGD